MKYLNINSNDADNLIRRSVQIAVEARNELKSGKMLIFLYWWIVNESFFYCCQDVLIAGSIGSYGACLCNMSEYSGNFVEKLSVKVCKDNWGTSIFSISLIVLNRN